jgi:hypothetical protein
VGAPSKSREAPLALKALYDADVAEEDIILAWHDKEDAGKVKGRTATSAVRSPHAIDLSASCSICSAYSAHVLGTFYSRYDRADKSIADILSVWSCDRGAAVQVLGVPAEAGSAVRKSVQAIIDWLEEASSEEDDEESDE